MGSRRHTGPLVLTRPRRHRGPAVRVVVRSKRLPLLLSRIPPVVRLLAVGGLRAEGAVGHLPVNTGLTNRRRGRRVPRMVCHVAAMLFLK